MGKRILVADDSQTIQRAFELALHGEGMTLLSARSYDQALQMSAAQAPDVVVADVTLGDRTGYDLCAAIKRNGAAVPVLILASKQTPFDEIKARAAGADGHIIKPFESQKLLEALNGVRPTAPMGLDRRTTDAVPVVAADADTSRRTGGFAVEDSYGEFTIEDTAVGAASVPDPVPPARSTGTAPALAGPPSDLRPTAPAPVVPPSAMSAGSAVPPRPSLIPGVKPGMVRPPAPPPVALRPPAPPARAPVAPAAPPVVATPPPPRMPAQAPPGARPAVAGPGDKTPAEGTPVPSLGASDLKARVASAVEGKVAAIAERGPEYAAIAKLSREIIEQVVWEVVPELAEVIIRENVERLAKK